MYLFKLVNLKDNLASFQCAHLPRDKESHQTEAIAPADNTANVFTLELSAHKTIIFSYVVSNLM